MEVQTVIEKYEFTKQTNIRRVNVIYILILIRFLYAKGDGCSITTSGSKQRHLHFWATEPGIASSFIFLFILFIYYLFYFPYWLQRFKPSQFQGAASHTNCYVGFCFCHSLCCDSPIGPNIVWLPMTWKCNHVCFRRGGHKDYILRVLIFRKKHPRCK